MEMASLDMPQRAMPSSSTACTLKTDEAAAKLIHHHQDPVPLEQNRLRPKQVQTPETVLCVAQKGQPRKSVLPLPWVVMDRQNSADHVFVDPDAKGLGQVRRDLGTARAGIAPFEFTDGLNQFRRRPFGPRSARRSGRAYGQDSAGFKPDSAILTILGARLGAR